VTGYDVLLIIDVQERLAPAMETAQESIAAISKLVRGAAILDVPIIISEHCAEKIGPTVPQVIDACGAEPIIFPKTNFSCFADFQANLGDQLPQNPILAIAGMETHVCVMQSALDFASAGYNCMLAVDAVASRKAIDREMAIAMMQSHGINLTTVEALLFLWMRTARHPMFGEVLELIKEANNSK
jgi:nicotinamidase-related amidase